MKKYIIYAAVILTALILLAGISGILAAYISPPPAVLPEQTGIISPDPLRPGDVVTAQVTVLLPGNMRIAGGEVHGGNIAALPLQEQCTGWFWNRRRWQISGPFRVLDEGKYAGLKLEFAVREIFSSRISCRYTVNIPEITAILPVGESTAGELALADEIGRPAEKNRFASWHYLWLLTIPAAIILWLLWKHRRKHLLTPAEAAMQEIDRLNSSVRSRKLLPEKAFAMLCDIMRNFLEARFALPAPRRTTQEFLQEFQLPPDLSESEQNFLKRFLNSADLIKFAGMRAGEDAFYQAAENAGDLIRMTVEKEEKKS